MFLTLSEHKLVCQYNKGKELYFDTPKTAKGIRKIPMINDVKNMLFAQKEKVELRKEKIGLQWRCQYYENYNDFKDLVFYTTMGSPLTKAAVSRATTAVVNRINKLYNNGNKNFFKKVHPHMFRHTFTVNCYENNINIKAIQVVLGHENIATTMDVYNHLSDNKLSEEFNKIKSK